jgi:oligopeptide/dipeptide ABC transporter ATP-binding protein
MTSMPQTLPLVEVENLAVGFPRAGGGWRRVVRGASLRVAPSETVGVVGESGCGKSLTALALTRLVPEPGAILGGSVAVGGEDVSAATEERLQRLRGGVVGYVFQDGAAAFNPLRSLGFQVAEAALLQARVSAREARARAEELLLEVGLDDPRAILRAFPHQVSGGQRQRVLLAAALAGGPRLLGLLRRLRERHGLAILLISHDLAVVRGLAQRITVLYAGETVEEADAGALLGEPAHPYARALVACAGGGETLAAGRELPSIPGRVPAPEGWGGRCRFAERCPAAFDHCRRAHPGMIALGEGRRVRCFLYGDAEDDDA